MQSPSADRSSNVDGVPPQPRLVGWKEIAAYFEKAERTVKRWEQDRNLPVYRVPGGSSASVFAYPSELKNWLEADPSDKPETGTVAKSVDAGPSGGASEVMTLDASSASNAGQAAPPPHWLKRNWRWAAAAAGLVAIAAVSSLLLFGDARLRLPDRVHALFGRKTAKSAPKA